LEQDRRDFEGKGKRIMITDFLKTQRTRKELRTALEVIREFKKSESREEWLAMPFLGWARLEQLEEFLAYLVENKDLQPDTLRYIEEGRRGN
jgi:hypothetical protein